MKKNNFVLLIFSMFLSVSFSWAQTKISGKVKDTNNQPLPGANVVVKGTNRGTTTDFDGNFTLSAPSDGVLVISFSGFEAKEVSINEKSIFNIVLKEGVELDEVIIVGSRSPKRTAIDTPVAIDVIDVADVTSKAGKVEINQLLQYTAPSFNASKQSGSDGADHIDPASLRGLGPDQTLVLINGKRRHQSSLINLFGTRGRGNTGTDLNAIPASAIKRIEILRDGASAQYGSDAIAGVINIVLKGKESAGKFEGSVSYGVYNTKADVNVSPFTKDNYGLWNTDGFRLDTEKDGDVIGKDKSLDGNSIKVNANYGIKLGEKGFINVTGEFLNKDKTLRPTFDFRKGYGEAAVKGYNFFVNASYPISNNVDFYIFGGSNYRDTDAYAFTRNNGAKVVKSIYPNGFTPRITSKIEDNSVTAGFKIRAFDDWSFDISNSYGKNYFNYFIKGTLNASLEDNSPTSFNAGGHSLMQNTINLELSRYFDTVLKGLNVAFGTETKAERFKIFAGEEASWGTYTESGELITNPSKQSPALDDNGDSRPGGSQGFPGYSNDNQVKKSRFNVSLFADFELDVTDKLLFGLAGRFEHYDDFGSTINGKFSTRYKVNDNFNVRGSISTGFRAPSLAQVYYNLRFTDFQGGQAVNKLLSSNDSDVTRSFGVGSLKEETALNAAAGFTAKFGKFTATVDGYFINVKDRIVLTGSFKTSKIDNVEAAQFFVNGVDTQTKGLDIVLSWNKQINSDSNLGINFAANFNDMKIKKVNNGDLDEQTFFGERDKYFLLASAPDSKLNLNISYDYKKFDANLGVTRFSEVKLLDWQAQEEDSKYGSFSNKIKEATDIYKAKFVTDLNLGYSINDNFKFSLGSNNLFNVYPDQQDDWTESGGYWDAVQMGFGGAFYYARLNVNF